MSDPDYIIIGAGAAGGVLAARLAEDKNNTVLLLEAGPDNSADETINSAAQYYFLYDLPAGIGPNPSPTHLGFQTTPQNGKVYGYPRGTGLGGSVNHHALVDGRGSGRIYDDWAKILNDPTWSYHYLCRFFKKMENFAVEGADRASHGQDGWLHVKNSELEGTYHNDMIKVVTEHLGIPFRSDLYDDANDFSGLYLGAAQIHPDGRRSFVATDLLLPTLERTHEHGWNNLEIATDHLVTKVIVDGGRAVGVEAIAAPRAYQVDVAHVPASRAGKRVTFKAKKEVILCGGSINTPQVLMLSGIGPPDHLAEHGIDVVCDLPGVGRHLQDHCEVGHVYKMSNLPERVFRWQRAFLSLSDERWKPGADMSALNENHIPLMIDWHSGFDKPDPRDPDLHIHIGNFFFRDFCINPDKYDDPDPLKASFLPQLLAELNPDGPVAHQVFLHEVLVTDPQNGSIRLKSTDPTEAPEIDLRLFDNDDDASRLARGIELTRKLMAHPVMKAYEPEELVPGPSISSLDDLKAFLKAYSAFGHHMSGTAKMGADNDPMAVLDSNMRVRGIAGLRVCDASAFPTIPGYNTSRPSYMLGEALADRMNRNL